MGTSETTAISAIDQLPDSRRAILVALKQRGALTIAELAAFLTLTGEAVRQQLRQLQQDGWIESRRVHQSERGRTGRPATAYALSDAGDHLFPKQYDDLTVLMLDTVTKEFGPEAAAKVLARLTEERVAAAAPGMRDLSLEEKIAALKDWYLRDDPFMEAGSDRDGFRLIERNCPFLSTAMRRPMLCSISVNALTRILGVVVDREEKFQDGDGRCVFRVHADQPIDPDTWQFRLEDSVPSRTRS
ncbi:MAG TPA: MarR family transcriptional regulator [Thermoanaerobaculia bacterium]|nr:MarR family transcriptional regulator [Thermoanaerobaculia bacterium]